MVYSKSHCQQFEHCTPQTFKAALTCAVQHHSQFDLAEIGKRAGILKRDLWAYCEESSNRDIPAEKLVRVVDVTGRIDLFRFLLGPLSFAVVAIQEAPAAEHLQEQVLRIAEDTGELAKETRDTMRDKRVDPDEKRRLRGVIDRQITHLVEARTTLDEMTDGRPAYPQAIGGGR